MEISTCPACGQWAHKCDHGSLHSELIDLRNEVKELAEWKSEQQRALVRMSIQLLDVQFKGDGVVEGVEWVCKQLKAYQSNKPTTAENGTKIKTTVKEIAEAKQWAAEQDPPITTVFMAKSKEWRFSRVPSVIGRWTTFDTEENLWNDLALALRKKPQ